MSTTLVAVIVTLLLGHLAKPLLVLRRHDWFIGWIGILGISAAQPGPLRGAGIWFALGLPLATLAGLQWLLLGWIYGVPSLLLGIAALFYAWGPRDLDLDVDTLVDTTDAGERRDLARHLFPHQDDVAQIESGALVEAVFRFAAWRWFGPLFWFFLLGPVGAVAYRLTAVAAQGVARTRLPDPQGPRVGTLHALLDWPVAQLMTLTLALAADFDAVIGAWRKWHAEGIRLGLGHLEAAARASVAVELAENDADPGDGPAQAPALLELRDAMSLVWRILVIWLGALALFVVAGWVG